MATRTVLISIKPKYAELLLDGSKTVELRRSRTRIQRDSTLLIYASSPARSLVGAMTLTEVDVDSPSRVWRKWGSRSGLSRPEFDSYFDGTDVATSLAVADVVAFPEPISLYDLRRRWESFIPPQSYRYVGDEELNSLLNGERTQLASLADGGTSKSA